MKKIITGNCPQCGEPIEAATSPQHFGRNKAKHLREGCKGTREGFSLLSMTPRELRRAGTILRKAGKLVKELNAL